MKTNNIPALVTLSAGAVYCIIGLTSQIDSFTFCRELLIVLIVFFVIGSVLKIILDKNFGDFGDSKEEDTLMVSSDGEAEEKEEQDAKEDESDRG